MKYKYKVEGDDNEYEFYSSETSIDYLARTAAYKYSRSGELLLEPLVFTIRDSKDEEIGIFSIKAVLVPEYIATLIKS